MSEKSTLVRLVSMPLPSPASLRFPTLLLGSLALGLASCSGGGGGGGGSFAIVSCSLGCSGSGASGDGQVSCGIQDVYINGELHIGFEDPIDPGSLSVFSVQVTQVGSGKTPPADRFVDPDDPTTLIYRPKLSFDSSGAPVFGLSAGQTYTIKLPGVIEDPGSQYVRSAGGAPNQHRMLCTVDASLGVLDAKVGPPAVTATVDTVASYDPVTGEPATFAKDVLAEGAVDVWRFSRITLRFNDLMNPASLVNPVTQTSNTVTVMVDPDGDVLDSSDQQAMTGAFTILLDQEALTTTVTFDAELGFPSAGSGPDKRKIVVNLPPSIVDLGGNPLSNSGPIVFTPEVVTFDQIELEEPFLTQFQMDTEASGGDWGESFSGLLRPGISGGSGRLGHLNLAPGQVVVLNTDEEDFSGLTTPGTFSPASVLDATFDGTDFSVPPVTGGVFEFASLTLAAGSQLSFEGSQPARVFVRGEADLSGSIVVAGTDALEHLDTLTFGAEGAPGGPSGGMGGEGGRHPSWVNFETVVGTILPPDPETEPPTLEELNGQSGIGVPDNLLAPSGTFGAGGGGLAWPQPTASMPQLHLPVDVNDLAGLTFDSFFGCATNFKGGVGAGGGFGLSGGTGQNKPAPGGTIQEPEAPLSASGKATDFGLGIGSDPELPQRRLDPEEGWLHGGGGGGGGGSHIQATGTNGKQLVPIDPTACLTTPGGLAAKITTYRQRSGPAGGGGGGALQLQAGSRARINGRLDASGGTGGGKTATGSATAGGGGAGGALLVQAPEIAVAPVPARIDIAGGAGGFGIGGSLGGNGGAGLLRLESEDLLTFPTAANELVPNAAALTAVGASVDDVVSAGVLVKQTEGPGKVSGVTSCWLRPDGNFFVLTFLADEPGALGWDMKILPNPPSLGEQSFRGDNGLFPQTLEELFGNELGSSPIVVRFQGARAYKQIDDLCDVDLDTADSPIFPGSLTGWVEHPAELNGYFDDPSLSSNVIRFQILFDAAAPFAGVVTGVTEIGLNVQPD